MEKAQIIKTVRETDKAVLVAMNYIYGGMERTSEIWFPKSRAEVLDAGDFGLWIKAEGWLFNAKEKDLSGSARAEIVRQAA